MLTDTPLTFGLLGYPLGHSFSKSYFEQKFQQLQFGNFTYQLFELEHLHTIRQTLQSYPFLRGFNVTIPHKKDIIAYCDALSEEAQQIGAVNCIQIENQKWIGFNTDYYGFKQSIKPFLEPVHERALILGSGGSALAVKHALTSVGVDVYIVSSSLPASEKVMHYSQLNSTIFDAFKLIVNTTPLGMFPDTEKAPNIPYAFLNSSHLCYDLIYNPTETLFLKRAKAQGALTLNGLSMLHLQAEKSWEIWNSSINKV